MHKTYYSIAKHIFCIEYQTDEIDELLPSYIPFKIETGASTPLFTITLDSSISPAWEGVHLGYFPSDSANFNVYHQAPCDYQILIESYDKEPCAFMQTDRSNNRVSIAIRGNHTTRAFGLNNAIMLSYTLYTSAHDTLLLHSSVVENGGKGYCFLGVSGRGKSTHCDLWVKHIPGSTLINDDNPVLRIDSHGTPIIYGSPWSGKRPVYKKVHYPIGGLTEIEQHSENKIIRQNIPTSFGIMLSSCSTMKFDKKVHMSICSTIGKVLEKVAVHTLQCRPDEEAAQVSSNTLAV